MNYRSTDAVLAVASSILNGHATQVVDPSGRELRDPADGKAPTAALVSARPRSGERPHAIVTYETDADEAHGVVTALRRARSPGASWSSIAVLARTNAQLVLFERELDSAGIPFRSGGGRAFLARPTVRGALDRLTTRSGPPGLREWLEDLTAAGASAATGPDQDEYGGGYDPDTDGPFGAGAIDDDLSELARLALEYLRSDSNPSPSGLVGWLEASLRSDPPRQAGDAVELVTFHRAKGLEWRVVFVTGLEDGLVPIAHAHTADALAEERRLLYVACTRAMDDLRCSWARERSFGGRRSARSPSPYVAAIEATHRDLARLADATPERSLTSKLEVQALLAGRTRTPREL
jgi:DNA helicase-2/ATP-dependent DNA helicase PcrA